MYYYKKNIGDYHKKAGRLSMLEHGAYTLLLDACYDRERFPTEDEAIEWAWARTDEEKVAVRFVLRRFFSLRDGVYVQERIEEEIARYHENASTNARIAREREEKRKAMARTVHEPSPEQHEAPPNQEPLTNINTPLPPKGEFVRFWNTWPKSPRKVAKAECEKKWKRMNLESIADRIIAHVEKMKSSKQWVDGYDPAPATYLNQRRWEDDADGIVQTKETLEEFARRMTA